MNTKTMKRQSREAELDELIDKIESLTSLESWNSLIRETNVPADLAAAFITMRPELVGLASKRDMTAEEVGNLYTVIKVLMETNFALQQHARHTAKIVHFWYNAFKQLDTLGRRIEHFANFRRSDEDYEVDQNDC
jgi:hypothetical protein